MATNIDPQEMLLKDWQRWADGSVTKQFDRTFSRKGLSGEETMDKCEDLLIPLMAEAAEFAKELLIKRGYFNGDIGSSVYHYPDIKTVNVQVVLTCYGLPQRNDQTASPLEPSQRIRSNPPPPSGDS